MTRKTLFLTSTVLVFLSVCMLSCRSHKELIYLRDVDGNIKLTGLPQTMPVYKIHKKDNLYVSIISPNPDLNRVYNPIEAGSSGIGLSTFFENQGEQFINGYAVDAAGDIQLPIIGKINLEGKSLEEAQEEVKAQATKFIKDATVKIKLLSFRVSVLGEVKLPGVYYNYGDSYTVLNAIANANGNTDFANLGTVLVLRPIEGGSETFTLNLNSRQSLGSPGYYLLPNDVVFVQPAKNKNTQITISTAALILSTITSVFLILNYTKHN